MRIWSIHPMYIDSKGLVALWRETLLAKHVLEGKTNGYQYHPQLDRFRKSDNPVASINQYLSIIYKEALRRGYSFNKTKFTDNRDHIHLYVTTGQLKFERQHLLNKLKERDLDNYFRVLAIKELRPHPIFKIIKGEMENWEKTDKYHEVR